MNKSLPLLMLLAALLPLSATATSDFASQMQALEHREGGTIGVAVLNTADHHRLEYRARDRFALCSTFKLLLVAAVLSRVDRSEESWERSVNYTQADLLDYAPITKKHLKEGKLSIADLSAAAIEYSDNTAANLLLQTIGGPEKLTRYIRSLGDNVTRIDRDEPTLNTNIPGDIRDTTTARAMVDDMRKLLIGDALSPISRQRLTSLLFANTTGNKKLRAGMDPSWRIGDKTGSGQNAASNDVAIVWPSQNKPFLIAVYYSGAKTSSERQNAVIAEIGRIVSATLY